MTLQITTVMTVPDSGAGRAAFVAAANNFGNNLTPWANQANAMAVEMNSNATAAATSKNDAQTAQGLAESARDAALGAAATSAPEYDPGSHAYAANDRAWSLGVLYRCTTAYTSGATLPKDDPTHWTPLLTSLAEFTALQATVDTLRNVPVLTPSGAYTVADTDRGRNLQIGGTLTLPSGLTVGTTFVVTNLGGTSQQITPGAGMTLRLAGTSKTGAVTLAAYSKATVSLETATLWMAAGAGLT